MCSETDRALALNLFEAGQLTLAKGARLAGPPRECFIELLSQTGTAAVSYPAEDL
jgi:predicted HTH domain antitoxin